MKIPSNLLTENDFLTADIVIKLRTGQTRKANILLFQFNDSVYAFLNHCMHMQRQLNCQADAIFDGERQRLRCSMHGFVFEPETGVCLSPVCEGQQLQPIKLIEQQGFLSLHDKQTEIVAIYRCGKELI